MIALTILAKGKGSSRFEGNCDLHRKKVAKQTSGKITREATGSGWKRDAKWAITLRGNL